MNELLALVLLAELGLVLHVIMKLRDDYSAMLATPDEEDDRTFWATWRKRNLVMTLLSLLLVGGLIVAQYYFVEGGTFLSKTAAFAVGYSLDSFLKNFQKK